MTFHAMRDESAGCSQVLSRHIRLELTGPDPVTTEAGNRSAADGTGLSPGVPSLHTLGNAARFGSPTSSLPASHRRVAKPEIPASDPESRAPDFQLPSPKATFY